VKKFLLLPLNLALSAMFLSQNHLENKILTIYITLSKNDLPTKSSGFRYIVIIYTKETELTITCETFIRTVTILVSPLIFYFVPI
jgi:hypothetical protein